MAKGRGRASGGKRDPGGFVVSAVMFLIIAGIVVAFARANNIDSIGAIVDWSRKTSDKIHSCLQPKINFWTCSFDGGTTVPEPPGKGGNDGPVTNPNAPQGTKDELLEKLASIKVGEPQSVDYNRKDWKHWVGDRCDDTRQQVLREQAQSFKLDAQNCKVESGVWIDPYTGTKFTDPSKLDIDHVFPLGAAAKNGGNSMDAARKQEFANDKSQLLAVSASANRAKSDKMPSEWWPENKAFSCEYASIQVNTASKYGLQFSKADVKALEKGLKTCD